MPAAMEVSLCSQQRQYPAQIRGSGSGGEFGPRSGSSCIGKVGPKETLGSSGVMFGPMRYPTKELNPRSESRVTALSIKALFDHMWHERAKTGINGYWVYCLESYLTQREIVVVVVLSSRISLQEFLR
eukprot:g30930.t1